jgi:hypothetical protein
VLRYTLPWVLNTVAVATDAGLANRYLVLGLQLAIIAGSQENGKSLSDFPGFAAHIKRVAAFRKDTQQFWVDGSFQDDIGLRTSGGFARVYQAGHEVAIMAANLDDKTTPFSFQLQATGYGITAKNYSVISSTGRSDSGTADAQDGALHGTRSLEPFELVAIVFQRENNGVASGKM